MHPDDRKWALRFCEESSRKCKDYEFEYRITAANGRSVWLHDILSVESEGDSPRVLRGYMIDITERKRTEEALRDLSGGLIRAQENGRKRIARELHDDLSQKELPQQMGGAGEDDEIVGVSPALNTVFHQVAQVAVTDSTVLLLGETGTGKELVARSIHRQSLRRAKPMVRVNCATLPASLIESELFGHEKGAFTGALTRRIGRFELADRGAIFLDEIGELAVELQTKLLRVLEEGEFERLGSAETRKADVRVIAATNRDLESGVAQGTFRPDLYYRLRVFPIRVPPLRERPEDIPLLVWHFIEQFQNKLGRKIHQVPKPLMQRLQSYSWPGNVRELQNVIERAIILSPGPELRLDDYLIDGNSAPEPSSQPVIRPLEEVEREHIQRVLDHCGWAIQGKGNAAELLGLNPSTLRSRLRKLGISRTVADSRRSQRPVRAGPVLLPRAQ